VIELNEAHAEIKNLKKSLSQCSDTLNRIKKYTKESKGDLYTVAKSNRKYVVKLSCLLREMKVDLDNANMNHRYEDEEIFIEKERNFKLAFGCN
jgi:hypothetical protein